MLVNHKREYVRDGRGQREQREGARQEKKWPTTAKRAHGVIPHAPVLAADGLIATGVRYLVFGCSCRWSYARGRAQLGLVDCPSLPLNSQEAWTPRTTGWASPETQSARHFAAGSAAFRIGRGGPVSRSAPPEVARAAPIRRTLVMGRDATEPGWHAPRSQPSILSRGFTPNTFYASPRDRTAR